MDPVASAAHLAETILLPAADQVDHSGELPRDHLTALSAAGLYGLRGPKEAGGFNATQATVCRTIEEISAGDLATALVWAQHIGVPDLVSQAQHTDVDKESLLRRLTAGTLRSGVALQAAIRPGPPAVTAQFEQGAYLLNGSLPWVSGWGLVDVLVLAARERDDVLFFLVEAKTSQTLRARQQPIAAVQASSSVLLELTDHRVPAESLLTRVPHRQMLEQDPASLRINGSFALGLAVRSARRLGDQLVWERIANVRQALDYAKGSQLANARADASRLAWDAAGALTVRTGSSSLIKPNSVERTVREAQFLLIFASRPTIRDRLAAGFV